VQDTKLFETSLGIQTPWHISRVALDTTASASTCGPSMPTRAGRARSASASCRVTVTPTSASGVTSTRVSNRRYFTRACRGLTVRRMGAAGFAAVGRGAESVHHADGAADHRSDSAVQHGDRRVPHCARHVG
jgi:hypothetical protein